MRSFKFIIGHKRPVVPFPAGFQFVTSRPAVPEDAVVSMQEVQAAGLIDTRVGEYAFLFALCRTLPQQSDTTVTIAQYRRFVLNAPLGEQPRNVPFARVVSTDQFSQQVKSEFFEPRAGNWLVSTVARATGSVLAHYGRYHVLRDWMRFCSDAVDAGCLTNHEALEASTTETLIPAPSNGVFPLPVLREHLTRLEQMALAFLRGGFLDRPDYQRRSLGFCLERMHSYLLLAALHTHRVDRSASQGFHTVISEEATVRETR